VVQWLVIPSKRLVAPRGIWASRANASYQGTALAVPFKPGRMRALLIVV
jgi:hypothetical protein